MRHHLYLGLGILVVLLVLGLISTACLTRSMNEAEYHLLKAWEAASGEDLYAAWNHTQRAKAAWERAWPLTACLMDHEKLQTIDQDLLTLEAQYRVGDSQEYACTCLTLTQKLRALRDNEKPTPQNILAIFVNLHKVFA